MRQRRKCVHGLRNSILLSEGDYSSDRRGADFSGEEIPPDALAASSVEFDWNALSENLREGASV